MPKIRCINNYGYMHPKTTECTWEDLNGREHPRFRIYVCDCGCEHVLDTYTNVWIR